jgi:hypothetical protein
MELCNFFMHFNYITLVFIVTISYKLVLYVIKNK